MHGVICGRYFRGIIWGSIAMVGNRTRHVGHGTSNPSQSSNIFAKHPAQNTCPINVLWLANALMLLHSAQTTRYRNRFLEWFETNPAIESHNIVLAVVSFPFNVAYVGGGKEIEEVTTWYQPPTLKICHDNNETRWSKYLYLPYQN
jgi:hypothetical protein